MSRIQDLVKDCTGECRLRNIGGASTLIHWEPDYDRAGNQVNGLDPNIYTEYWKCDTCNGSWEVKTQQGKEPVINVGR